MVTPAPTSEVIGMHSGRPVYDDRVPRGLVPVMRARLGLFEPLVTVIEWRLRRTNLLSGFWRKGVLYTVRWHGNQLKPVKATRTMRECDLARDVQPLGGAAFPGACCHDGCGNIGHYYSGQKRYCREHRTEAARSASAREILALAASMV